MGKLYVAYGSNLNLEQMADRCPTASIYSRGMLDNWELLYKGSPSNAHATIRKKRGARTPVLVWNICPDDERRLDLYEGYPIYYFKKSIMVNIGGAKKKGMVYIMNEQRLPGRPSAQYVETIRQGYLDNSFDMEVLESSLKINALECK